MASAKIYTISPELPFVDILALGILERYGSDPITLSQVTILLPSRRACRALQEAFLRTSKGAPMLLPHIRPVGDVDEEGLEEHGLLEDAAPEALRFAPVMPPLSRVLLLARQVWELHKNLYGPKENIEQSVRLAMELGSFMDDVARKQLSYDGLAALAPDDYAAHWQEIIAFLKIITEHWPQLLLESERQDPITRRNLMTQALSEFWRQYPPAHPVIAAGSTGSIPATADLLKTVAELPNGMIILPGLDKAMHTDCWEKLGESHPQQGLKKLLTLLGTAREDVPSFTAAHMPLTTAPLERIRLLSEIMRPPETTDGWMRLSLNLPTALSGITRIDAATQQEEARIIGLILRQALEEESKTAALITHDRSLAKRVAVEMRRYDVTINDSAGTPLSSTRPGVFLRLVMECMANRAAPVSLLALLKHPLASGGMNTAQFRFAVRQLEIRAIRGVRTAPGFASLSHLLAQQADVSPEVNQLVVTLERIGTPLLEAMQRPSGSLKQLIEMHIACAEALAATDSESGGERLWRGEIGEECVKFIGDLLDASDLMKEIDPISYRGMFSALMGARPWRPKYGFHPRLHILSPVEARLQHFDTVILGGLTEGCWPQQQEADPWMSRPMREKFGLPSPEQRIGQSAHDFVLLASAPRVFLTRAERSGTTPTVPSRWLLRLDAVLAHQQRSQPLPEQYRDPRWLAWARLLHAPGQNNPQPMPQPTPPAEARLKRYSVTQVESLKRNPYQIYAQHILKLPELRGIDEEPDAAAFGNIIHQALEQFLKQTPLALNAHSRDVLLECGRHAFAEMIDRPAVATFWWPRFERIAEWVIAREAERRPLLSGILAEVKGEIAYGPIALNARLDRIELQKDGSLIIIDYKTGGLPSKKDVETGRASQLILQAVIAGKGGIAEIGAPAIAQVEYWRLSGGTPAGETVSFVPAGLMEAADSGVEQLLTKFADPATPFTPGASNRFQGYDPYAHLARNQEWGEG